MGVGVTRYQEPIVFTPNHETNVMKTAEHNRLRFEIVEDNPEVGFYLYVYDGEKCIADHLQNDEETCMQLAFEDYGVDRSVWREKVPATDG
jgi:hypothetical protein